MDILDTAGYGGGFLDYDADGWPDVLLVGSPRCRLLRNTRDGRFIDVTTRAGLDLPGRWQGCASGDFDNDGDADLFLSGYRAAALFRSEGGRFTRVPLPLAADAWSTSAVFFDYDNDGWLDLYVGCYVEFGSGSMRLCDFSGVKAACPPTYYDAQQGHLFRNLQGKSFRDVTTEAGAARAHGKTLGAAACDFNGDGWTDLYLANDGMPGDLFVNTRGRFEEKGLETGTAFSREGTEQAGMGVDWGDVDEDGRPDLVVTTFQFEPKSLYMNRPAVFQEEASPRGIGAPTVNRLGFGVKFADFDNDSDLDLLMANGHVQDTVGKIQPGVEFAQLPQLFRLQQGTYAEVPIGEWLGGEKRLVGRAVALADYDRDGRLDALITNLTGSPLLLHNDTPEGNHWLSLRLEPRTGPRDGTGCEVVVEIGKTKLKRHVTTGGGYLSCSEPRVHLGLGGVPRADRITVRWPSGKTQEWRHVAADRRLLLRETETEPRSESARP